MANPIKYFLGKLILFLSIILLLVYLALYNFPISCSLSSELVIPKGASLSKVIKILEDETCFKNKQILKIMMVVTGKDKEIRPGRHNLEDINSIGELMAKITGDRLDMVQVTILEGWTMHQISRELYHTLKIDTLRFISLCNDKSFIRNLDIKTPKNLEGYLYPETYFFPASRVMFDLSEEEIISNLVEQLKKEYSQISKKHSMSMHEILTLGSIIQGECIYTDEMKLVSSVYHNRLSKGWLLQADPTIQYLKPGKNKRLYNKDYKRFNSAYNTYLHKGLPPGPISNPGIDAIKAAMEPIEADYMFFVAKGDGYHHFSKTEDEHNKAKAKFLKELW